MSHILKHNNFGEQEMDKVNRPITPKREDLIKVYDVLNKVFKNNPRCFYTKEQFKKISKEKIEI